MVVIVVVVIVVVVVVVAVVVVVVVVTLVTHITSWLLLTEGCLHYHHRQTDRQVDRQTVGPGDDQDGDKNMTMYWMNGSDHIIMSTMMATTTIIITDTLHRLDDNLLVVSHPHDK